MTSGRGSIVVAAALVIACGEVRSSLAGSDSGVGPSPESGSIPRGSGGTSGVVSAGGGATNGAGAGGTKPTPVDSGAPGCGTQVVVLVTRSGVADAGRTCAWDMPSFAGVPLAAGTFIVRFEDDSVSRYQLDTEFIPNAAACATLGRDAGVYYDDTQKPTAILGCPNVCSQLPFASPGVSGGVMEAVVSQPCIPAVN